MQPLTDAQRDILLGDRIEFSSGCEVLNIDLSVATQYGAAGDITDDFWGGSISYNGDARIHRTARLRLSIDLPWGAVLLRPYMVVNNERFNLGVFAAVTPEQRIGEVPSIRDVACFDRVYLLDREIAADDSVASGTSYRSALIGAFADAGLTGYLIDGSADDYTLPEDKVWPLVGRTTNPDQTDTPVTHLRKINDLLLAINFAGVWADSNGLFRCHRYINPSDRAVEFTFDADDPSFDILSPERVRTADIWRVPNEWVFLWQNGGTGIEGDGIYTVTDPPGSMTLAERGLRWSKVYKYDAASQAVLESLGDRRVAADLRITEQIKVTSGPFPAASHNDVISYVDTAAGGTRKVIALSWEQSLDSGSVSWLWEAIG